MDSSAYISASSAIVAVASALISLHNSRRDDLNQKINTAKWKREYFADLLEWADECLVLLSEAMHLCDLDPKRCKDGEFFNKRHALRVSLSTMIDKGRWFFPNVHGDKVGIHKEAAFRGYRQEVLSSLVYAYRIVSKLDYIEKHNNQPLIPDLVAVKRKFTSEIQIVLDPKRRDEEFSKIISAINGAEEGSP